jgi:hypothetical protein
MGIVILYVPTSSKCFINNITRLDGVHNGTQVSASAHMVEDHGMMIVEDMDRCLIVHGLYSSEVIFQLVPPNNSPVFTNYWLVLIILIWFFCIR